MSMSSVSIISLFVITVGAANAAPSLYPLAFTGLVASSLIATIYEEMEELKNEK